MAVSAFLNGTEETHPLIASRALAYGDGLFETIAYRDGVLRLWDRHMARLLAGCKRLDLAAPDIGKLRYEALAALGARSQGVVKILIARSTPQRGYSPIPSTGIDRIVQAFEWPDINRLWHTRGIKLGLCNMPISENARLAGIKHLNRLEQVLAAKEVVDNGWDEGLMCTANGRVVCGTKSNYFTTKEGTIYTPELSLCGVAGVMRERIIANAKDRGLAVKVTNIYTTDLDEVDGMFISNALIGLVAVTEFCTREGCHAKSTVFEKQKIIESLKTLIDN